MFAGPIACAVIGRTRHKMMQAEINDAAKHGAKLIELRLDFLAKAPDFKRLLQKRPCPLIATFRRPVDGGRFTGTEERRMMMIRQAIVAGFDYVDLEMDIIDQIPRFGPSRRIVSYHNVQEVPEKLEQIYQQMCEEDADVVKIAVTGQRAADNLRVLALLKNAPKPTIAICMGDLGTSSRLLGLRMGVPFTYGAYNRERQIAPGILSFQDLQKIYHVEGINKDTQFFGVIGDPVGHSLSPLIHNAALRELGINARYLPFRVPRGELAEFVKSFQDVPVQGYSVTIPHKEGAAKLADEKDDSVATMGAANTLLLTATGWRGVNTDARAALDSLRANLPLAPDGNPVPLVSRSVLILGAGGVARAIAYGLHQERVQLAITNRTDERGLRLAEEIGCKYVEWSARHNAVCDTLINCTSVGMHPNLDESPIHQSFLRPDLMVFDTIYTPETTMLIREARTRGCHVLTGVDMFVRQAGLQFELFTGQPAPYELMTKVVRRALSPVHIPDEDEPAKWDRRRLVYLIGYRGSGKSTVAQLLAQKLGWACLDADAVLEERWNKSIQQTFADEGEHAFRAKETLLLREFGDLQNHVIATGGGVIMREDNRDLLMKATVVWLKAPADVLWQRLQQDPTTAERRPDLAQGGLAEVEQLLLARTPMYQTCQEFTADTAEQTPEQVAETIYQWLKDLSPAISPR